MLSCSTEIEKNFKEPEHINTNYIGNKLIAGKNNIPLVA